MVPSLPYSPFSAILTLTLLLNSSLVYAAQCYWTNGVPINNPAYQPCSQIEGQVSMCCRTNTTDTPDVCLPNGLCRNDYYSSVGGTLFWRETCSTPDWTNKGCLNICNATTASETDSQMKPCAYDASQWNTTTKWCCGNTTDCCTSGNNAVMIPLTVGQTISSSASTTTTSGASTVAATSNPTSSASTDTGLSTGAKAGIGVGVAVGALAAIIGAVMFFLWRQRRNNTTRHSEPSYAPVQDQTSSPMEMGASTEHEVDAHSLPVGHAKKAPLEMEPQVKPVELAAETGREADRYA